MGTGPEAIYSRKQAEMASIIDRVKAFRDGGESTRQLQEQVTHLQEATTVLVNAYQSGPFDKPPEQLIAELKQLREYDPAYVDLLVDMQLYDQIGGTGTPFGDRRILAVQRSERLWQGSPIGQLGVQTWTAWGLGDSVEVTTADESAQPDWDEYWKADRNAVLLGDDTLHELSDWLLILGNQFLAYYSSKKDGLSTVRTVDQDEIKIITNPNDALVPWFYKREHEARGNLRVIYYPDWTLKFGIGQSITLDEAWAMLQQSQQIPRSAERADLVQNGQNAIGLLARPEDAGTDVCMQHIRHWRKDRKSLWGWPLTTVAGAWLVAHRRLMEAQLSIRQSKAQFVRTLQHQGGSRANASLIATMASQLSQTQPYDTNPPSAAGGTFVHNRAVDYTDLPMTTGASDFKSDHEAAAWHAGSAMNMNTTTMGLDTARYATAVQMDRVQSILFNTYKRVLATQFAKMTKIVLSFREMHGGKSYADKSATTSIDSFTLADFPDMVPPIRDIMNALTQAANSGIIPSNTVAAIDAEMMRPVLYALDAVDVQGLTSDEAFGVTSPEEDAQKQPESDEEEPQDETETEAALRAVARNYASGDIDVEQLAENVIAAMVERQA